MAYVELTDIKDEFMKAFIVREDLDEAEDYINELAKCVGVSKIIVPPPFKVKKLAVAYACMLRAKYKTTGATSDPYNNNSKAPDAFELKRRIYADEVKQIVQEIQANPLILTGGAQTNKPLNFNPSIPIFRR